MQERLVSIDVGIRNLAYCVFDESMNIVAWNIANLMTNEPTQHKCNQVMKNKTTSCKSNAKYCKGDHFFCDKHAKQSGFLLVAPPIKKMSKDELTEYAAKNQIDLSGTTRKPEMFQVVNANITERLLQPISSKRKNAGKEDLISIGRNMKTEFDKIPSFQEATTVIIENQISPIATRMKTIQGMVAQYFIMRNDNTRIVFVSSSGKLKGLAKQNEENPSEYKQHKNDAVYYCNEILKTGQYAEWATKMDTKKKDDLADCFLQGFSFMKHNIILKQS